MFEPISNIMSAIALAFTAPLLAALGTVGEMPPPIGMPPPIISDGQMPSPPTSGQLNTQDFQADGPNFQAGQPNFQGGYQGQDYNRPEFQSRQQFMPGGQGPDGSQRPVPPQNWNQQVGGQRGRMMEQYSRQDQYDDHREGQQQQFGGRPPQQGPGGMMGQQYNYGGGRDQQEPNQEDMSKQQEEMQKKMEGQQLQQMKRGITMMKRGITIMKSMTARAQKQGVSVPEEYLSTISKLESAIKVIENATEMSDDVFDAMDTIREDGDSLRELGPKIGMLTEWPKILKNASSQLSRLRKQFDQAKVRVKKSKIDTSEIEAKIEAEISEMEKARDSLKIAATKTDSDFEEIMSSLREDVFEKVGDAQNDINILRNISSISSELKKVNAILKNFDIGAARLKKAGKNTARLEELILEAKQKRDEVKTIVSSPNLNPDKLFEIISDGESLLGDISQEFATLENRKTEIDSQFEFNNPVNF